MRTSVAPSHRGRCHALEPVGQRHQDGGEHCGDRQRDGHVRDEGDEVQREGEDTGDAQGAARRPMPRVRKVVVSNCVMPRAAAATFSWVEPPSSALVT